MRIILKRVYEPATDADGFRVLVDRLWPRGVSRERAKIDLWAKDVAPSAALRTWFGHDPAKWDAFRARYAEELDANAALAPVEASLAEAARAGKTITLVYGAKDERHNQAVVLRDRFLRETSPEG